MQILTYNFLLLIILLGISFATLNSEIVSFNYYIGHTTLPLSLLLVLVFASGCVLGLLVGLCILIKIKIKNYRLTHQLKLAEKEIENLRAIPLKNEH